MYGVSALDFFGDFLNQKAFQRNGEEVGLRKEFQVNEYIGIRCSCVFREGNVVCIMFA